ncbi:MAG: RNA polymerase sigma factor [Mucilaginibacter sp.]|uniref:RNA polymerase sigma factor n=1 Tax=Mucilaginibacter sp. TaxID=1882438 RepID=UPI0034E5A688
MALYQTLTDQELVSLLRESDHTAYNEIYNRYSGPLYLHAYNKLRSREEAMDILQELFSVIWNNRTKLNFYTSLSAYLNTAIRNRIFKHIAHKQHQEKYITSIQESVNRGVCITDHLVRQNQLAAIIEREIDALPPKMKEIFLLSRKNQLSHKEIAGQLNIAEPTVKKQVNNALKILRVKLGLFAFLVFLIKF